VAVCYLWLDRPLALLVHAHSAQHETFARLTYLPDLLIPLAAAAFVAFGLWALAGRPLSKIVTAGALCSISLIVPRPSRASSNSPAGGCGRRLGLRTIRRSSTTAPTASTCFMAAPATRRFRPGTRRRTA